MCKTISALPVLLFVLFLLAACGRDLSANPREALFDDIGMLRIPGIVNASLQTVEAPVANGMVIAYRWQPPEPTAPNEKCGAATHVVQEAQGWYSTASFGMGCSTEIAESFVVGRGPNSAENNFSSVYGFSNQGSAVRIYWSDGEINEAPLEAGAFVGVRPENLLFGERFELLDREGNVLAEIDEPVR